MKKASHRYTKADLASISFRVEELLQAIENARCATAKSPEQDAFIEVFEIRAGLLITSIEARK